ncbi:hypothetical protein FRC12_006058 [Ceratobasidium sp. 428]|nr:hypothetical protein FRC12_006058 [Ceratobasidium sp. 428]
MCTEIVRALHGPGAIHQILCERFAQASSWNELLDAFLRSAVNRGADQLVCTVHQPSATSDDYRGYVKQIIYDKIEPDLENLLALTDQCEVDANDLANQPEQNAETKESDSTSNGKTSSHASAGECRRRRKEDEA